MSRSVSLSGGRSSGREECLCDYRVYRLSGPEWVKYILTGTGFCALTAYVFYRSVPAFLLLFPAGLCYPFIKRKELLGRRQDELRLQFKEAILSLSSSLTAGYSVENAFSAVIAELRELYGEDGMITREFSYIAHQLRMNRTAEALLCEFARRSGLEEAEHFAEIFAISKRSRGELVSVVSHVVHVLGDRIQVREEIRLMTAEKQFEQKFMNMMPYLIVLYVDISSPGFFSQMYETAAGRVVMTCCLGMYALSCALSDKILKIEV